MKIAIISLLFIIVLVGTLLTILYFQFDCIGAVERGEDLAIVQQFICSIKL